MVVSRNHFSLDRHFGRIQPQKCWHQRNQNLAGDRAHQQSHDCFQQPPCQQGSIPQNQSYTQNVQACTMTEAIFGNSRKLDVWPCLSQKHRRCQWLFGICEGYSLNLSQPGACPLTNLTPPPLTKKKDFHLQPSPKIISQGAPYIFPHLTPTKG